MLQHRKLNHFLCTPSFPFRFVLFPLMHTNYDRCEAASCCFSRCQLTICSIDDDQDDMLMPNDRSVHVVDRCFRTDCRCSRCSLLRVYCCCLLSATRLFAVFSTRSISFHLYAGMYGAVCKCACVFGWLRSVGRQRALLVLVFDSFAFTFSADICVCFGLSGPIVLWAIAIFHVVR